MPPSPLPASTPAVTPDDMAASPGGAPSPACPPAIGGPFRVREVVYAAGERMPPHAHSRPSVTFVLTGELREIVGGADQVAGPLSVVVKPMGVIHEDAFGPRGARTLQVIVREPEQVSEVWKDGWRWLHARSGVREFLALARALAPGGAAHDAELESLVWDVFGALSGDRRGTGRRAVPPWLLRVREELDDRLLELPEVRELAASAGVHPVSLTRAFRRHFGETVTEYRLRRRLQRGAQLLSCGEATVSEVAHASGFADHPHFSRTFRRTTGVPPSEFRRLLA